MVDGVQLYKLGEDVLHRYFRSFCLLLAVLMELTAVIRFVHIVEI